MPQFLTPPWTAGWLLAEWRWVAVAALAVALLGATLLASRWIGRRLAVADGPPDPDAAIDAALADALSRRGAETVVRGLAEAAGWKAPDPLPWNPPDPRPRMGVDMQARAMLAEADNLVLAASLLAEGGVRRGRMRLEAEALRQEAWKLDRSPAWERPGDFAARGDFARACEEEAWLAEGFSAAAAGDAAGPAPEPGEGWRDHDLIHSGWALWHETIGGASGRALDGSKTSVAAEVEEVLARLEDRREELAAEEEEVMRRTGGLSRGPQ